METNCIKATGFRIEWMVRELIIMLMVQSIKDSSRIIGITAKENTNFLMELYMKANGKMASCMELAFILMQAVGFGTDNLEMVFFRPKYNSSLED